MARIKLNLKRIDPVKAGIIQGAILALISLVIVIPTLLIFSVVGLSGSGNGFSAFGGGIAMLFIPIIYGIVGFVAGLVSTALLNFVLSKTNGLDVEFDGKDMEISQIGEDSDIKF